MDAARTKNRIARGPWIIAAGALIVAMTGCTVRTGPPVADAYVYAGTPPGEVIYQQPRTTWNGRTVYWYEGRWYTPDRGGWVYLRQEPPELYRHRSRVHQAPPAYGPRGYGGGPYGPRTPPPLPAPR
jgi:hypothetical protein